jgi:hypothetical protein
MANVQFGTNVASIRKKRVYYTGSDTINQGMAVCYDYDTTTNVLGYDTGDSTVFDSRDQSTPDTTAEGNQNEAKFLHVEQPSDDNIDFLAGFVAPGGYLGTTGPKWIDIYEPNGAIVPVRTDVSCTVGQTRLYLEGGDYALGSAGAEVGNAVRLVALAEETVDRSSTAGLVLARVQMPAIESVAYDTAASPTGPGEDLWQDCPWLEMLSNPGVGFAYFDDYAIHPQVGVGYDATTIDVGTLGILGWTTTVVSTGSVAVATEKHGVMKLSSNTTNDDNGIQAQLLSCYVDPAADKTIWFEARVKFDTGTDQYFVGLASADTTLIASGALDETNPSYAGFARDVNTTAAKLECVNAIGSGGNQANATGDVDVTNGTFLNLGMRITSTSIQYYVDGVLTDTHTNTTTASIPTAALALSLVSQSESGTTKDALSVDWVRVAQLR